jgi:hypothetical protein
MWAPSSPMRSDIDLLVVTASAIPEPERQELLDLTYPLYLECGRQISPHFLEQRLLGDPRDERQRRFLSEVERDGVRIWGG